MTTKKQKLENPKQTKGNERDSAVGLEKWIKDYNAKVLGMSELREKNLKYLNAYKRREEEAKRKEKNGPDDEGWTTVTKKGRNPGLSRKESVDAKLAGRGMETKGLPNIYRFQLKESKIKQIENMRKQFEVDKQKVNALKQARKFKPY